MEKRHGNEQKLAVCVSEFIGTFILSLVFCVIWTYPNEKEHFWQLTLIVSISLYVLYTIFGPISGGHFNPAVTLAVYFGIAFNTHNLVLCFFIILSQFTGAFMGMVMSRGFRVFTDTASVKNDYPLFPQSPYFGSPIESVTTDQF